MPQILKVTAENSEEDVLESAAAVLASGGVIAYPTETFYGLGADAMNDRAVKKIYKIKGRDFTSPISVIIGRTEDLSSLVSGIPTAAEKLINAFWPGPLTIIFEASSKVLPRLTAGTEKIGVRLSGSHVARSLAQKLGHPVTATSANLSGRDECSTASAVVLQIGKKIDAIVDSGPTAGHKGSTIVDVTSDPPAIIREGAIPRQSIKNVLKI